MGRLLPVIFLAVAATSARADAPAPIKVAVIPGIAVNLDTARVDALSQDLAEALSAELEVEAIGGLEVRRQLPPDGLPADCVTQPACAQDVARRTGAQQLLFVVMVDSGDAGSVQIDTTWVDPASGRSAPRPAVDLASASDARAKFASVARQLLPDISARAKPVPTIKAGVSARLMTPGVPRHFTTTAKITAGVGVVGLGLGITFGLIARSKYHDCDDDPFACTNGERDSIRNTDLVADIGFGVALACAVATGVMWATSAEEPHVMVAPTGEGVGAAVTALGRF